ncbi:MAG: thymidine phosphorylase [Ruminococcus sp.]|nr:thymidine phosphorylase [Ruminococcus sp.]
MRMYDIIDRKKNGEELTKSEIEYFVGGFTRGEIPDYQASALLMAIWFCGMNDRELADLTLSMAHSGDMINLDAVDGFTVDKHSTGGVGDKTTLIVAPAAAACGGKVAKMSGRGLGFTGGTIDKLESIPGFNTSVGEKEFIDNVNKIGLCIAGQTGEIAPADKKIYALRDVTATVDSIPLIASSIMSKKLAAGSKGIVLDAKCGSGAFMKTYEDAKLLAEKMTAIGQRAGRKTVALITNMDIPLGRAVGNALEVKEAVKILKNEQKDELYEVSVALAAHMLSLVNSKDIYECEKMVRLAIENGSALEKLKEAVDAQGGDISYIDDTSKFIDASVCIEYKAEKSGYINKIDAQKIGRASVLLGAGREKKDDVIDFGAGIYLCKKTGDEVREGDTVARLYTNINEYADSALAVIKEAFDYSQKKPYIGKTVLGTVGIN